MILLLLLLYTFQGHTDKHILKEFLLVIEFSFSWIKNYCNICVCMCCVLWWMKKIFDPFLCEYFHWLWLMTPKRSMDRHFSTCRNHLIFFWVYCCIILEFFYLLFGIFIWYYCFMFSWCVCVDVVVVTAAYFQFAKCNAIINDTYKQT